VHYFNQGPFGSLKKVFTERALNEEMGHHLAGADGAGNSHNYARATGGSSPATTAMRD
jgi:hypothetical protein